MSSVTGIALLGFVRANQSAELPRVHGWAKFLLGEYEVDGFVVRVDERGVYHLEFPARIDRQRRRHPVVRHADRHEQRELAARLLDLLRRGGWLG